MNDDKQIAPTEDFATALKKISDYIYAQTAIKQDKYGAAEIDLGEISDGYHTFNELYHQRAILFATIVNQNSDRAWKSYKHEDGKYCFDKNGEWFIVGIDTPQGSYTYHYEKKYWDVFKCKELECGKHWDGHTEKDVIRLLSLRADGNIEQKQQEYEKAFMDGFESASDLFIKNKADGETVYKIDTPRGKGHFVEAQAGEYISKDKVNKIINKWLSNPYYELKDNIYDMTKAIHELPSISIPKPNDLELEIEKWVKVLDTLDELVEKYGDQAAEKYQTEKSCDTCKHDEAFGCPSFIHDRCESYSEWEQADKSKGKALEQEPKTGHCKDCKWWKDSDGTYRRGVHAESQCPINRREVLEGNGYCYVFEPQESEDKE